MSYEELTPKIDSVKHEADKLFHLYTVTTYLSTLGDSSKRLSSDYFIYTKGDSLFGLLIDSNNNVIEEYRFLFPNSLPSQVLKDIRTLTPFEKELYEAEEELKNKLSQVINNEISSNNWYKLFLNDGGLRKLYSISYPLDSTIFPIHNNYLLMQKRGDEFISIKKYHNSDKYFEIINQFGDTVQSLMLINDFPDLYLYSMDILVFKVFRPKWWLIEFTEYSRKNRRSFIYNVVEDRIKIVKFPNEE